MIDIREIMKGLLGETLEERHRKKNKRFGEGHRHAMLTNAPCKLVPIEPGDKVVGGRKSRRRRQQKWVRV